MDAERSDDELKRSLTQAISQAIHSQSSPHAYFLGIMLFTSIVICLSAAPSLLPMLYLGLAAVGLPFRFISFFKRRWQFYLVDFCYAANVLVIIFLLISWPWNTALHPGSFALVYVVAEGPLAAALLAWQCAWIFSNLEHTLSTLIHVLPGLSLFALRHLVSDLSITHFFNSTKEMCLWMILGPVVFYCAWQLGYYLLVQVAFRSYILHHKLETSYHGLAMRAKRSDNWLHCFIRRGSAIRRVSLFGGFQLAFTLFSMVIGITSFYSFKMGVIWQVVKFGAPLWYGALYQTQKVPEGISRSVVAILSLQEHADPAYTLMIDSVTGHWKHLSVGGEKKETSYNT
jgi:hypothetical protein